MFSCLLKPFLGLLTVGGLGTGSYFLYKHSISKTKTSSQEGATDSTKTVEGAGAGQNGVSNPAPGGDGVPGVASSPGAQGSSGPLGGAS